MFFFLLDSLLVHQVHTILNPFWKLSFPNETILYRFVVLNAGQTFKEIVETRSIQAVFLQQNVLILITILRSCATKFPNIVRTINCPLIKESIKMMIFICSQWGLHHCKGLRPFQFRQLPRRHAEGNGRHLLERFQSLLNVWLRSVQP